MKDFILFLVLLLIASLLSVVYVSASNVSIAPAPVDVQDIPGTWYLGATPYEIDYSKSPVVFVQGLHGNAKDWWEDTVYYGKNDMYDYFYSNGYRTAFVQLEDATGGDAADMWDNGLLLADMLKQIYDHFGEKVNIVAHSKGGVDTQTALIHYDAWPYANDVITLGSPHYGTPLADLAYSWYANWLADLIERTDEGTYAMQTGEMEKFRSITDNHENTSKNEYYTASGTGWGPVFSALWFGGLYLWGDSDGLIPESSTRLPYGTHFFQGGDDVDHDNIRIGNISFENIHFLFNEKRPSASIFENEKSFNPDSLVPEQFVRGSKLPASESISEVIPVESGNQQIILEIVTSEKDVEVILTSPNGKKYNQNDKQYYTYEENNFMRGGHIQTFVIDQPIKGDWNLDMISSKDDAYFMIAHYKGSNALNIKWSELEKAANQKPKEDKVNKEKTLKIDKKIKKEKPKQKEYQGVRKETQDIIRSEITNVTYDIIGTTKDGETFYRTAVRSYFQ
ncbi:esterase/lipase family protein [Chengkuizengella axinellae]|uniref:GPI inositol-deacylase PGAP1-like alpha/beta domain-containing protein n=1 Tax=Chengkuizengella axinellae TaxID=3064388 RepID=A0ABT9J695_9BACL|nr:hypothetical protein [Chengkuizengella sp. 2205SS18-9]MDP5276479.1 hypothetical protein [Chengkuizengella sp. 2205SS18-9]